MDINIKVDFRGTLRGSAGWISELIEGAEIVGYKNKNGDPSAYLEKGDKKVFLCAIGPESEYQFYSEFVPGVHCADPSESSFLHPAGMFPFPLSEKAQEIARELIVKAAEALKEKFEE